MIRATVQATAANPGDTFVLEIRKTFKRKPIGETLASERASNIVNPPSGQTTPVSVDFTVVAPFLEEGKRYALVIIGVLEATLRVQTNTNPGCRGALWEGDVETGRFTRIPGTDMVFATVLQVS